jgi:demethylmenaquinone methyltransferase/2-methoxy-6-polyprenyl-1,4-benzoquinol methylase
MSNESSIKPYADQSTDKKAQVTEMFDNISGHYDRMNRLITFGMDVGWRKKVLKIIAETEPQSILDIATGTGDMPMLMKSTGAERIVGIDISAGMLSVAKQKVQDQNLEELISFELGDAENLPYANNTFDAATVSYGIRNFQDLQKGLSEILRVLSPDGVLVILETSVPESFPMKQGYWVHTKVILPLVGRLFSSDKRAYSYLGDSAHIFPYGERLKKILLDVGYTDVAVMPQAGGISTIYKAQKKV